VSRVLVALLACGCATSQVFVPPEHAARLQRSLAGEERFLAVAFFSTPFFADTTRRLLTPFSPDQVRLLDTPDGSPVNPGPVERTFAPGTRVRILKVEFPTAFVMTGRVLLTPRTLAWVYLDVAGTPKQGPPFVLVLRPGLKTEDEVRSHLDLLLSTADVTPTFEAFSEPVRAAVLAKQAIVEMPAQALVMAWGLPAVKKLELEGTTQKETWTWPDGKRAAVLINGQVTELR